MKRPLWWMLALSLAAALAALAATPPNLPKALAAQRQLAEQRPQDAGVQNDLGNLYLLARQPDEAEAAYQRALQLDPKRVSALFNLGLLEQDKGRLKDAKKLFEQVVAVEPQHAWAHYQIGAIAEAQGHKGEAVDEYSRAFALNPQLAFPDVNPHVVGSRLMTESMLRAYRQSAMPPQAPKAYEQPGRIASILVAPAPAAAQDQMAGKPQTLTKQPSAAGKSTTVLSEGSLPHGGGTGQALPPGVKRPAATPGAASTGGYRAGPSATRGATRNWPRPDPNLPNSNLDADEDDPVPPEPAIQPQIAPPPGVGIVPSPNGLYYQPRVTSSGRLEIKLMESPVRAGG